jgi:transcriptional regulator with XRE-family HTH domain
MDNTFQDSETVLLAQVGHRLARRRIDRGLTQTELARQAGVGKRTVERLEAGCSTQMSSFIRILRVLELLEEFLDMIPDPGPSPMDVLRLKGKERKRASSKRQSAHGLSGAWTWRDES